ncbi:hypothetical protein M3Y94_00116800 [Aphelenchoides besseyi]|nr:hypothetical protein M3Y94_00116800 [Aphelenchoides besseyi]KAI6237450.1 hypothetical protein M3Y95_00266300 [Aphelenchoides besseyi]
MKLTGKPSTDSRLLRDGRVINESLVKGNSEDKKPQIVTNHKPSTSTPGPTNGGIKKVKISRRALQQHLLMIQSKKRKRLSLRARLLIQEEFEDKFVRLNSPETSDSESEDSEVESDSTQFRFLRRSRPSMMKDRRSTSRMS